MSNHAHVLLAIARDPQARVRDIAEQVGITERAVALIIDDLEEGGYLTRSRVGRRNVYKVQARGRLRHRMEARHTVGEILAVLKD